MSLTKQYLLSILDIYDQNKGMGRKGVGKLYKGLRSCHLNFFIPHNSFEGNFGESTNIISALRQNIITLAPMPDLEELRFLRNLLNELAKTGYKLGDQWFNYPVSFSTQGNFLNGRGATFETMKNLYEVINTEIIKIETTLTTVVKLSEAHVVLWNNVREGTRILSDVQDTLDTLVARQVATNRAPN